MKVIIKNLSIILVFLLLVCPSFGQSLKVISCTIHFESGKYNLSQENMAIIDKMMDSVRNVITYIDINVKGYTDNEGSLSLNKRLSERRDSATKKYLMTKPNIHSDNIKAIALGPLSPIDDNNTMSGRAKNRRVEIMVSYMPRPIMDLFEPVTSIFDLYKQLEVKPQEFCINPKRDTVLRCLKGTVVYVKAGSFKLSDSCSSNCVTIKVKEDFLKSEMILDNLSTTSNGGILESQGMVYTEADDCRGKKLSLEPDKDMVIFVPTDTPVPETKIFQGNRNTGDSVMNWTASENSVIMNFTLKEVVMCKAWVERGGCLLCENKNCRFFFCRIKRFGSSLLPFSDKKEREYNRNIRLCENKLQKERKQAAKQGKKLPKSTFINTDPTMPEALVPKCMKFEDQLKKYGVKDANELMYVLNKPLMDSFKVKTAAGLRDTLAKKNIGNIELSYLNKKLAFEDFKYYVYNISSLGWSNVDKFADLSKDQLGSMTINLNPDKNMDCKLVFKKTRSAIPADTSHHQYIFKNVPIGVPVWIVALNYRKGTPYLSMQETTIENKTYEVNFKPHTLEELKKELRKLDE